MWDRRIFLDACLAESTFYEILKDKFLGLSNIYLVKKKNIVIRIFLTTSKNYKYSRFKSLENSYKIIDFIPMPKFVWVCEISTLELYKQRKIIGEIVLDATAFKDDKLDKIILLRYPNKLAYRIFNEPIEKFWNRFTYKYNKIENEYDMFSKNLEEVQDGNFYSGKNDRK